MGGALALVSAGLALTTLPPLPARGLARETQSESGVELETLAGRPLVTLRGLDLAPDQAIAHTLVLRDRRGTLFALGRGASRLRRSPGGDAVLAQWSAECEVPVAYRIFHGRLHAYARESAALGWLPDGAALIHFPKGPCGGTIHMRGIDAVPRIGKPRLVFRTPRFAQYQMWGG
jgi:hypothetical protein